MSYSERLKRSPEFTRFRQDLEQNADILKKTMESIANRSMPVNVDVLVNPVAELMSDAGNGMGALEMLQNLREYDDAIFIHCMNVALIANVLARWMKWKERDIKIATAAGLLHDIGKTQIPQELLSPDRQLSSKEEMNVRTHTTKGYEMVKDLPIDNRIKNAVLMHHERRDGSGYPFRLHGDQIDSVSGIIAVADAYEEMTSARALSGRMNPFDVIAEFEKNGLQKYHTAAVMTFLSQIANTFIGNRLRLSNGMEGELVYVNPDRISRPTIKTGDSFFDLNANRGVRIMAIV